MPQFSKNLARARRAIFANSQSLIMLTLGSLIMAATFVLFFAPTNIAPGGITGIVLIITNYLPLPAGLTFLTLNIPLLILGFYTLGRFKFLTRTAYVVLISNLMVDVFASWLPAQGLSDDVLLNALYGAVGSGVGFGLILRAGGNSGGTGVLSRVIQLRTSLPISQIYVFTDGFIIVLLGLVFGWENALYSMLALFVSGIATDYILEGPNVLRMVFIVTEKPENVAEAIRNKLYVGVTKWAGQGTYSKKDKAILLCTVPRSDAEAVKSLVLEYDEFAFVVIAQAGSRSGGVIKPQELEKVQKGKW